MNIRSAQVLRELRHHDAERAGELFDPSYRQTLLDSLSEASDATSLSGVLANIPHKPRERKLLAWRWVLAAVSVVAVGVAITALVVPISGRSTGTGGIGSAALPSHLPGAWKLVGYMNTPNWQVSNGSNSLPMTQQLPNRIVCPTPTTCFSVGIIDNYQSAVIVTHDGGRSWHQALAVGNVIYLMSITCPISDTCMVVGSVANSPQSPTLYTTRNSGQSWTSRSMPGSDASVVQLSCTTASKCVTVELSQGNDGSTEASSYFTSNAGVTWSSASLPPSFEPSSGGSPALYCFPGGHCISAGMQMHPQDPVGQAAMLYSSDGGAHWTAGSMPTTASNSALLSCSDEEHCVAIEIGLLHNGFMTATGVSTTADGGASWSAFAPGPLDSGSDQTPFEFDSISCASDMDCWTSGLRRESTCEGSCPYVADQGVIMSTTDGGRTWSDDPLPAAPSDDLQFAGVSPLSCGAANGCFAVADLELTESANAAGVHQVEQDVVLSNMSESPSTPSTTAIGTSGPS